MKLLLFEYITGGGLIDQALSLSLVQEGLMMLNAVANDFSQINGVDVYALRDYRLSGNIVSNNDITIEPGHTHTEKIELLIAEMDALLVIAPESNNILATLCEDYSKQGCVLLNSNADAIRLTSNKLDTYHHLLNTNIAQIPTYHQSKLNKFLADQYVIKPIDGAGCENLVVFSSFEDLMIELNRNDGVEFIVQPFVRGKHASLSLLCWEGECQILSVNEQCFKELQETLVLRGCNVNAFAKNNFMTFCETLIKAFTGLSGYIGVDILITEHEIVLVEINPRITTSYIGLKEALGINPAQLILECFNNQKLTAFEVNKNSCITVNIENNYAA